MIVTTMIGIGCTWSVAMVILFQVMRFEKEKKLQPGTRNDAWLFSDFQHKIYREIFHDKKPELIAPSFRIDVAQYYRDCGISGEIPDLMNVIVFRIFGLLALLVGAALFFVDVYFACLFILYAVIMILYPTSRMHTGAEEKKNEFESCIPRYLDLLQAALEVMPIEQAIRQSAERIDSLLSRELLDALGDVTLGASNWREALEDVARRYQIDMFSELVLDINVAYEKGIDILDPIKRKKKEYMETYLQHKKEKMMRIKSKILFPIVIFKIFPVLGFLLVPVIVQLQNF